MGKVIHILFSKKIFPSHSLCILSNIFASVVCTNTKLPPFYFQCFNLENLISVCTRINVGACEGSRRSLDSQTCQYTFTRLLGLELRALHLYSWEQAPFLEELCSLPLIFLMPSWCIKPQAIAFFTLELLYILTWFNVPRSGLIMWCGLMMCLYKLFSF